MSAIVDLLLVVAVVSFLSWMLVRVRRLRDVAQQSREQESGREEGKKVAWLGASVWALFGIGVFVRGIVALRSGEPWALSGKMGAAPVSPGVAILLGAALFCGACYYVVASMKEVKKQ